jgi:hypothetical protein
MRLARITLAATAAAVALAIPAAAAATPNQPTGKDGSCRIGPNSSTKAQRPTASAAEAGVITIRGLNEVDDRRSQKTHDNDNSGGNSAGDTMTQRFFWVKRGRRVGVVRYKSTLVTLNGSQAHLRDEFTATIRRQGSTPGGHLYGVYEHDEDFNQQGKVGDIDRLPITRGDGRFEGYTGEVISRVVRVAGNGQPFYRDTIVLRKQQP